MSQMCRVQQAAEVHLGHRHYTSLLEPIHGDGRNMRVRLLDIYNGIAFDLAQ